MSLHDAALRARGLSTAGHAAREWESLDARAKTAIKVGVVVVATVAAYHYSLQSLAGTLTSDTPLAYLGLVPLIAAALAWIHRAPRRYEPPIHDRQLDYTIGIPLILVAIFAADVLPQRLGAMAWVNRLDLLFLPLFVIGATVLLFGVRVAWRQRSALGYLFLLWPWPYATVLLGAFDGFRSFTLRALDGVVRVLPVATPLGAADAGRFEIVHQGKPFTISVITACSGVNGMVGFFLVGVALMLCSRGPFHRKALWIGAGLVWLWCLNVVRLIAVFAIGASQGPDVALHVVHPFIGLVTFALGVATIVAIMPRCKLELVGRERAKQPNPNRRDTGMRSFRTVAVLVLAAAIVVATGNAALARFDPVANAAGEPRLSSFLARPAAPVGWTPAFQQEVTRNRSLFGASSRWFRYLYLPSDPKSASLHATLPVTADVIDEDGLAGFEAYGVTACYSFHGYTLHDIESVDLGHGVTGQVMSYSGHTAAQNWSIVYWIVPVRTGDGTRYERVILYLQNTHAGSVRAPGGPDTVQALSKSTDGSVDLHLAVNRAFLVAFARDIVSRQRSHHDFDVHVAVFQRPDAARAAWLAGAKSGGAHLDPHDAFWRAYFTKHPVRKAQR